MRVSDRSSLWALSTKGFLSHEGAKGSGFSALGKEEKVVANSCHFPFKSIKS
jgi:hypothetical protein